MGLDNLLQKRQNRLNDPDMQAGHAEEWKRVKESWGRAGNQAKETSAGIIYNTLIRPFVPIKNGKKREMAPAKQMLGGAADSVGKISALVGRILLASGRTTKYMARKTFAI